MQKKATTYRKKIRDQQKSIALFDIVLQNVDYGIFVRDKSGTIVYENQLASTMRKKYLNKKTKLIDRNGTVITEDKLPSVLAVHDRHIHSLIAEVRPATKKEEMWLHIRAVPVFDKHDALVYVVVTWRNVTHRILEERRREHFIAIGSHELRTPLAGIKVLNQVLSKLYYEKKFDQARSFFHKIDNKVNLLTRIIQDFIEVEKIRGGKLEFTPEYFDFDEFVDSTIQDMNAIFKSHTIRKTGSAKYKIIADRERVYEVLTNLLANARKYSPDATTIDVHLSLDSHKITVGVQDYGIGLTEQNIANIFEPFYRVKDPLIEKVHGLGLGLYIAYKIIELHGGRMWVKSKLGKGSTFYFTIPLVIKKQKTTYEF